MENQEGEDEIPILELVKEKLGGKRARKNKKRKTKDSENLDEKENASKKDDTKNND